MPLPERWRRGLGPAAIAALARAEAHVADREAAGAVVYPPASLRYRALELVPPQAVKVVILGQDPYHGAGQAMGLAFSVPRDERVPPSLLNVFKEIATDLGFERPAHGSLESWASQGVLLLNTCLTVEEGAAASHAKIGWDRVTSDLVRFASQSASAAVFMLWGNHARAKGPLIDRSRHLVLEAAHPSPLSARKFIGCRHFSQANAFLGANGQAAIDWRLAAC